MPSTHDELRKLQALQRVTDVALGYLPLEELLRELLERIADILGTDTAAFLLLDEAGESLAGDRRQGHRGGGRAGRPDPGRARLRGPDRGRAARDLHRGRRPRRHPQPDPAGEGHPLAARRPAARRGPGHRRAARRHARPAPLRRRPTPSCCSSPPTAPRRRSSARGCSTSAAWSRCSSAASCRRRCRPCPAWSWRRATSRPCGAAGSAATGTTRSPSAGAGSRSSSAT